MRLKAGGHDFDLPTIKYEFNERSFIVLSLFYLCDFSLYCITIMYLVQTAGFCNVMCDCHVLQAFVLKIEDMAL